MRAGKKVSFKFGIDEIVKVKFSGEKAIISVLAFDDGGINYYVKSNNDGQWWREDQLEKIKF